MPKPTTMDAFPEEVLAVSNTKPVLVALKADWCAPCKALEPLLARLETELAGTAAFVTLDVDLHSEVARVYNVRSVPTLLLFRGGTVVDSRAGAVNVQMLRHMIEKAG